MAHNEFAYFYDEFNGEADYEALYAHIKKELEAHGIHDGILADLGCGTGELTLMLTQAGYDMIGIDQSEEMLCVVRDKAEQLGLSGGLLLLRQDLLKLDLYGTIRGAVSTFDTFNHIPDLDKAIANAGFFMEKGGVLLFDMNTPYKHQNVLGENVFTFEEEDASCVWRNHYSAADRRVEIRVDIDYRETGEHFHEQFCEYTYDLHPRRSGKARLCAGKCLRRRELWPSDRRERALFLLRSQTVYPTGGTIICRILSAAFLKTAVSCSAAWTPRRSSARQKSCIPPAPPAAQPLAVCSPVSP